jgi:hypothetical protein
MATYSTKPHFDDLIHENVNHILQHIEHVNNLRRESLSDPHHSPYHPVFIKVHYIVHHGYSYAPVIYWRRYGRSLFKRHGMAFLHKLLEALYQYAEEILRKNVQQATFITQGLSELCVCWWRYLTDLK